MFSVQTLIVFVFVCLFLHLSSCDRCSKKIKRKAVQKVILPAVCTKGTLEWQYPERFLEISIPASTGRFTLCVGYINDPFVTEGLIKMKKKWLKFKLPSKKGQTVCMKYKKGLTLKLCGPSKMKTYIAYIPYTITKADIQTKYKVPAKRLNENDSKTK